MSKTTDIREAIESELGFDPLIDGTNIAVNNLNGEVALSGTVPSYPQFLAAERAAKRVAGVTGVHNHLKVVLPPEGYRDDAMLSAAANNALTLDVTVPEGVEATARNGSLTLTGSVSYGSQREAAERGCRCPDWRPQHQRQDRRSLLPGSAGCQPARPGCAGPVSLVSWRRRRDRGNRGEPGDT